MRWPLSLSRRRGRAHGFIDGDGLKSQSLRQGGEATVTGLHVWSRNDSGPSPPDPDHGNRDPVGRASTSRRRPDSCATNTEESARSRVIAAEERRAGRGGARGGPPPG